MLPSHLAVPPQQDIAPPGHPAVLRRQIEQLIASATLAEHGSLVVVESRGDRDDAVLHELGRLRELTFRAVGEGTGRALDLDGFDRDYTHLVLWDRKAERIAGAYRAGLTAPTVARAGVAGLYTSTLFDYDPRLFTRLGPAVELGRSFICADYQRSFGALLTLWRGIGRLVVQGEPIRWLFGPVSISADYGPTCQWLIAQTLWSLCPDRAAAAWVRPRNPLPLRPAANLPRSLDELDGRVAQLCGDDRAMPVLLRQYLRLNGRVLGFNVDPDFSNVVDALVLVDLLAADPRQMARYLGADGIDKLRAAHRDAAVG